MIIKNGFVLRNVAGEHLVMPTGDNVSTFGSTLILNDVAAFIWTSMETPKTRQELLEAMLNEFEVPRSVAEKDLDALIAKLRSIGVVEDTDI